MRKRRRRVGMVGRSGGRVGGYRRSSVRVSATRRDRRGSRRRFEAGELLFELLDIPRRKKTEGGEGQRRGLVETSVEIGQVSNASTKALKDIEASVDNREGIREDVGEKVC